MRALPVVTLGSVIVITASSEYEFARTVLEVHPAVAGALPLAIDTYVLAAFRTGRDIVGAMVVMALALTAAMGAHLVTVGGRDMPAFGRAATATVVMVVLVGVAWRVHVLIEKGRRPYVPSIVDRPSTSGVSVQSTPIDRPAIDARSTVDPEESTPIDRPSTRRPSTSVDPTVDSDHDDRRRVLAETQWIVARLTDDVRHGRRSMPDPTEIRDWARALDNPIDVDGQRSRRIKKAIEKRLAEHGEHRTDNRQEA